MGEYFERYVDKLLNYKRLHCGEIVPVPELCCVMTLCKLLSCLASPDTFGGIQKDSSKIIEFEGLCKIWFMYW